MSVIPAFVFAVLLGTCSVGGLEEQTCDVSKRSYVIQPDAQAYIGVVMAMHESAKSMYGCGAALDTMKTYEAMRWALGRINQNSGHLNGEAVSESYIPGVKIGLQVHDSCSRPEVGTEALFDIVPNMAAQERWCHTNRSKLFLGVIGDVTSDTTAAMADLLGKYKVAQVSFAASAPSFRNRAKYPYLLRTVRPAIDEARAMARVAVALNWTYVAVVHTDSMTGMEGFTEFVAAAKEAGVCVTLVRQINETGTTRFTIQETINDILQTGVTGVVYFGEFQGASSLFAAVDRVTREANLQWLVGSSVGNRDSLGLRQAQARGVIAVTPASTRIAEFEDHWAGLNENNLPPDSPWYAEWYMTIRRCRLNGVNYLPFSSYVPCSQLAPSESRKNYKQFYQVESAILAVFSYAKALKMAHAGLCGENYRGMCDSLVRYSLQDFYRNYLQVLNFTFTKADRVPTFVTKRAAFTRQGELATTANFDVWSFSNAHGGYTFTKVGTSTPAHAMLDLDSVLFYNKFRTAILREHPASVCPNGTCTRCLAPPSGSKTVDHIYSAGDVLVTGMFPVQDAGEMAHVCGKVTATGAQYAAAFLYAIERVANLGILSSQVTLGGFAFSDCSRDDVARNILTNLATGSLRLTDGSGTSVDQSDIQALVTLAQNATGVSDIPVLGAWSRSTSVTRAPLVARIIPSSEKQMRALVLTLKRLQWKTIQLVHAGDDSGSYLATQFKVMAAKEGICAAVVHTLDGGMTYTEIATDIKRHHQLTGVVILADVPQYRALMRAFNQVSDIMFVVSLERGELSNVEITDGLRQDVIDSSIMVNLKAAPSIEQFKEFLRTRSASFYTDNPWFQEWYETAMNCYLDDANQKSYTAKCKEEPITMNQSPDVIHIINAVEAIARGLDATLQYYCGATYTTVCTHYRNSPDHNQRLFDNILQANFYDQAGRHFRFVDRQADLPFEIVSVQSGRFVELGTYSPGFDTINMNMAQTRIPTCPGSCAECDYVYDNSQGEVQQNVDILIGGIFDIHSAATSPLSCGDVSTDGYPYLEGLKFALNRVNSGEAPVRKLPGVTVGTVAFDACSSDLRAADKVTEYHADIIGNDRNSAVVKNIKHLVAWVTQVSTSATLEVGDVTRELGRPHLGITTGSANLTDRSRMSTFFNLQGTDDKVAQAIIRFVAEMGWKYVQVVHENSEWGRGGLEVLRAAGISRGVCVVTSYELQTHGTPHDIVTKLQASPAELVITFLNVTDISHMLQAKQSISGDADHLVFVVYDRYGELNVLQNNTKSAGANMLVFRPDIAPVPDFEAVLSRRNPNGNKSTVWFKEYYERMYRCNLKNSFHYEKDCQTLKPVTEAPDYHRNIMMRNVMNAVYAITTALDSLLRDRCGWSYSGVCDAFWEGDVYGQLIKKLERADFTDENGVKFKFTDRQYLQGYSIYQYTEGGQSRKVATYKGSALRMVVNGLSDEYKTTTSTCGSSCAQCQYTGGKVEQFEYIDGDIIIGSVFNMHLAGSSAFTCGDINPHQGVQLMEAFKYALDDINSHKGIFKGILTGVTLGGLSLDACESATRAGNLLANLHSGYQSLATPSGRIDPANIAAYVGAMDSDTSKQMARVLNVVRVPQISYGATSIELSDPVSYPYFLRTVPGDDKQARAMIALLARFGVKYVQVVFSPSSYGTQGAAEFTRQAKARGICVAQNMTFDPSVTADVIVTRMLKKLSASVVIVFLDVRHIKPFLQAVQRNSRALGHFHFIGSEVWAISRDALKETGDAAAGAIYLGVETADLKQFDAFLVEKRLGSSVNNAWFDEYFQLLYRCHLPGSSSLQEKYPDECSEAAIKNGAVRASTYQQDPYVLYTVNAVYAAALGVDAALRNLCGNNYTEVCPSYRSSSTRSQLTLDGIRAASFRDATMQEFVYNDKGESSRGYHIYATKKSSGGAFNYYTNNIGSYNDTHLLKITTEFDVNWVSNCKGKDACSECPLIGKHQSHYMQQQSPEAQRADDINVIGLFDVHAASADALQCGPLNTNTGFYNLLAFFYAINQVNANTTKYHGVKLGATAIDTCGSTISVTANVFSILSGKDRDWVSPASVVAYVVGGGSRNSEAATQLLSPRRITTISPTATAVSLSSAPYFLRTVLPNDVQAAAMADITASMNWIYFSMVSSDNDYSKAATTAFLQAVRARNNQTTELPLCMANHFILRANATDEEAKELIKKLDATSGSRVVVLFTSPDDTHRLLLAAKSKGLMGRFVFLGSEQWGNNSLVVDNVDKVARGAITLQAVSGVSKGFRHYVSTLTVGQHGNIPDDWFDEFWQRLHKCRLENATVVLTEFTRVCSLGLRISEDMVDSPASVLQTIIATQQVALGLANINECRSSSKSLAECISTLPNRNELIYKRIKGAVWVAPSDELVDNAQMTFNFTEEGHGNHGYNIYNYQKDDASYSYKKIGDYKVSLHLDHKQYKSYEKDGTVNPALLSQCPLGQTCSCVNNTGINGRTKAETPIIEEVKLADLNSNFSELWGIILTVLTIIGILVTLFMFVYLLIFYPIKGGTSVLGFLLLFGVMLIYIDNFAFLLRPTDDVCAVRRFSLGVVYALCFACMLIKVLNTWSIESYVDYYAEPVYHRLAHPLSLFLLALAITAVQVGFATEWLILSPARYETVTYHDALVARCAPEPTHYAKLIMSCIYVMVLIALTFIFSLVTWDSEENHNESRFVFFVTCFTIVIWIVWTIVATMSEIKYEDPAVIIANLANATIILVLIFVRKMYLLKKYEKDIKEEKRSRMSSFSDKDGEVFHNISYIDDTGHHASTLGGSAVMYHDGSIRGADAAY